MSYTTEMRFVDTNVLLYGKCLHPQDASKRRSPYELLDEGNLAVSVQVLQEFYSQVTRVSRPMPSYAMSKP